MMKTDILMASKFLQRLAGVTLVTFQTFDDSKVKVKSLNTILHGMADSNMTKLSDLNEKGAGIFVMVNEGDGKGRKTENVIKVRAVFIDLDGEPLPEKWKLVPHIIVESSAGRFHAYWLVIDCPLDKFTSIQKILAAMFNGDKSVNDLPRVMRVPGFIHQKGEPFMTRIISMNDDVPYSLQQVLGGMDINLDDAGQCSTAANANNNWDYFKGSTEGGRTKVVVRITCSLAHKGFSTDELVQLALVHDQMFNKPPLESTHPGKVKHTVLDAYKRYIESEIPEEIVEVNDEQFLARDGGKTVICREEFDQMLGRIKLHYSSVADMKSFYANRKVKVGTDKEGKPIYVPLGPAWMESKHRRQYEGIVMSPNGDVKGYFNRWKGYSVKSVKGSWKLMKEHIRLIVCDGDDKHFQYVIGWLAKMFQQPWIPAGVALVLQGGRGTGKGVFVNALCRILGQHSCHVFNGKHISGHFNAHMEDCILLFADEAFWAGDKAAENVLKGLITEPTIPIERKFADLKHVPNMLHLIMASNNEWVVPAGMDERRYCVLKVSNAKAKNSKYFDALIHEIEHGGLEAMLHDLLQLDVSNFNIRDVPQTVGLLEQKLQTLDSIPAWWFQKLQEGEIVLGHPWKRIPTDVVHTDYCQTTSKVSGQIRKADSTTFGMGFKKLLPDGWPIRKRHQLKYAFDLKRVMHYELPPLEVCRKHFETVIGENIDWDEPHLEGNCLPVIDETEL